MPSFMYSKAASVGACCRVNLLPGRPCTITFVFGGSPGSGTGFMINSGIRYALAKADIFVRAQQLWTAKAWQRSKRGRSGLRCCEATVPEGGANPQGPLDEFKTK